MTAARPSKPRKLGDPVDPGALSYEQAIAEAEAIVDRIEAGEAGIEDALAAYERGLALINRCRDILEKAEQRVTELSPGKAGGRIADSADEDADSPDDAGDTDDDD